LDDVIVTTHIKLIFSNVLQVIQTMKKNL